MILSLHFSSFDAISRAGKQYPRKIYLADNGLIASMNGDIDIGRGMENLVFTELCRRSELFSRFSVYYWREYGKCYSHLVNRSLIPASIWYFLIDRTLLMCRFHRFIQPVASIRVGWMRPSVLSCLVFFHSIFADLWDFSLMYWGELTRFKVNYFRSCV